MYLSAEQRGYGGGRERLSSSTVSPSLVTTSREVRLKRPVLSYRSDAAATKGGPALNISGRCLPLWSQVERGRCLTVLMHMRARLQESELLTSDMKVNRTANAFVVQEIGASPPPPFRRLAFLNILSGAWRLISRTRRVKPLKNPMNSEAMSIFFRVWTVDSNIHVQLIFALLYPSLNRPREVYIENKILYIFRSLQ